MAARAFTLIEMLVVISIVALLAALVVGINPAATQKKIRNTVETELNQLVTVIESYKVTKGHYPPDNPNNPALPPLFYELTGTISTKDGSGNVFKTINGQETIASADIRNFFGIDAFINSAPSLEDVKNFHQNLKPGQYKEINITPDVEVLVVPSRGPEPYATINPWRYNSSNPTNNPDSFDLWAEVIINKKTVIIGNWKE